MVAHITIIENIVRKRCIVSALNVASLSLSNCTTFPSVYDGWLAKSDVWMKIGEGIQKHSHARQPVLCNLVSTESEDCSCVCVKMAAHYTFAEMADMHLCYGHAYETCCQYQKQFFGCLILDARMFTNIH
jgi:hypothetical protein